MLKNLTPAEQLTELDRDAKALGIIAYSCALVGDFILKREFPGIWDILFTGATFLLYGFLAPLVSLVVASWLGKIPLRRALAAMINPNDYPRTVQFFLDSWWKNEIVLNVFRVVLPVVFSLACYRFLGPKLGLIHI